MSKRTTKKQRIAAEKAAPQVKVEFGHFSLSVTTESGSMEAEGDSPAELSAALDKASRLLARES